MWAELIAQNTRSVHAQRVAVTYSSFTSLAANPHLHDPIREAVWGAKLTAQARAHMAGLYPDARMGAAACAHRYHNVAVAWARNPEAVITSEVTQALKGRKKPAETDKICLALAQTHPAQAVSVVAQLSKEAAPRATMWMWAYDASTATDAEVAQALATYSQWGDEYGHKYVAAVLGTRPGVANHASTYTDPVVVTSLAGCRHLDEAGAWHVAHIGDTYALMALLGNPVCPREVCAHVEKTTKVEDVKWMARTASERAAFTSTWADAAGVELDRVVRRAAGKARTWEMGELLTNPNLNEDMRQLLAEGAREAALGLEHLVPELVCEHPHTQERMDTNPSEVAQVKVAYARYQAPAVVAAWDQMGINEAGWVWLTAQADTFRGTVTELGMTAYAVGQ